MDDLGVPLFLETLISILVKKGPKSWKKPNEDQNISMHFNYSRIFHTVLVPNQIVGQEINVIMMCTKLNHMQLGSWSWMFLSTYEIVGKPFGQVLEGTNTTTKRIHTSRAIQLQTRLYKAWFPSVEVTKHSKIHGFWMFLVIQSWETWHEKFRVIKHRIMSFICKLFPDLLTVRT